MYIYINIYIYAHPPFLAARNTSSDGFQPATILEMVTSVWMSTLPKTNSSPLKTVVSNRNILFQGAPIFRGELLVSGRVILSS